MAMYKAIEEIDENNAELDWEAIRKTIIKIAEHKIYLLYLFYILIKEVIKCLVQKLMPKSYKITPQSKRESYKIGNK